MSASWDSATLWGPATRSGLGRPATHSRDEITAAAVAIADADGLSAVSFRRVAAAIGAGTMSLYSYVPDKDTLIELMIDRVGGEVAMAPPTGNPHDDLRTHARALRAVMRRHPWLPAALVQRQTLGPNTLAGMDHVLALLAPTALDLTTKMEALGLLTGVVANYALFEVAQVERAKRTGRSAGEAAAAEVAYLIGAAQSGRYPHLAAALAAPVGPAPDGPVDPDRMFDRVVNRIVSGLLMVDHKEQ